MNHRPYRLKRRIVLTLLVKVIALTLLWWFVVRDHRTHPDPQAVETHFLATNALPRGISR